MKVTKELVHVIDFKTAPVEIQDAAKVLKQNLKDLHKANTQFSKWREEKNKAQSNYDQSFDLLSSLAQSWNPPTALEEKA